ncbi:MAG TPA: YfhO family protein, partial [Ferruginibacter sp.]|nr:YfhO family protein [Ferruginibacter sp.]
SLATVLENSMNPTTTLSMLTPFGTTANESWLDSSILMRNIYMGIIPLLFLIYAFYNKQLIRNKELKFFFFSSIIMLGMAWGSFFFLRQLAYYTLPLMDSFRHPALFRLFTIFFFLLIAAAALNSWERNRVANSPVLKNIILSLTGITSIIAMVCLFLLNHFSFPEFKNINLKNLLANLNFGERYLIQFPFTISFLLLGYWAIIKKKRTQLICLVIIADLFFATQLNMPVTVFGAKSFKEVEKLINRNPVNFPLPDTSSIEQNSLNSMDENVVTGSKIPFTKKIGRNDYFITPGNLALQDDFYSSPIKDIVFKNSVLYFADSILSYNNQAIISTNNIAFTDNPDLLKNIFEAHHLNSIKINSLSANKMEATVLTKADGLLIFQQNNYPGWKAFVDEEQTSILPVNISFMAIKVLAGSHSITFKYRPQTIIYAWYISIFSALLLLVIYCFLIFSKYQQGKPQKETVQP